MKLQLNITLTKNCFTLEFDKEFIERVLTPHIEAGSTGIFVCVRSRDAVDSTQQKDEDQSPRHPLHPLYVLQVLLFLTVCLPLTGCRFHVDSSK